MIIVLFCYLCNLCVPLVLWYCWLGLLTCKNRRPYNLYCVGGDVKPCTITIICLSHACQSYVKTLLCLYFINLTVMLCLEMSNDNVIEWICLTFLGQTPHTDEPAVKMLILSLVCMWWFIWLVYSHSARLMVSQLYSLFLRLQVLPDAIFS